MSYFQQRAKELKEMGVYVPPSGEAIPGESYFQQRLREYNASPPGNIEQPQSEYIMKRRMGIQDKPIFDGPNLINVRQSPLAQEAAAYAASFPSAPEEPPDNRNEVQKTLDYIFKENPVSRVLNRPFAAAAAASVPDAPMMDRQGNIPGTSAREEFLKKNPMLSTGNETVDKVSDVAGNIGSYFLNPAGAGQGPIALYKAAEAAAAKYLPRVTEKVVEKLPNAGLTLSKDGTKLVESLASKGVREGAKEAAVAATYAVPRSLIEGESSPLEIAQNVALEGSLGAATGFAAPFVGAGIKEAASKVKEGLGQLPVSKFSPFSSEKGGLKNPKDTRSHIVSKTEKDPLNIPGELNKFYEKTFDNIQRINQFDKYIESTTGKPLSPSDKSYMLALNSRGADMISNHVLTERLVDAQGNVIGKSLKETTSKIPKGRVLDFEDYLIAKHAQTRMGRGEQVYSKKSGMDLNKVAQKISEYEQKFPEFQQLADEIYEFNDKLGKAWLVDTGIISPETWAAWKEQNPFWIPNKRKKPDIETSRFRGTKRGFGGQSVPVKGYKGGSEDPIISPIESLIEYADQFIKTAKRNEVMQTIIRQLERNPEDLKGFAEIVQQPEKPDDILKVLMDENGIEDILSRFNESFDQAMKKQDLTKGNIVSGLVNGNNVHVKVNDPALLEALTNLTPQGRSVVLDSARKLTNMMKVLTTGINPVFSLTRNIFYDIPQAFVFSKTTNNPVRFAWDLLDGVVSTIGNRELYRSYKAVGGGHSSSVAADRNLLAQSKRSILPNERKSLLKRGYNALENLSNVIESAPRLGEYKRITKKGGDSYDSKIKGLYEAQDVTTNFKRFGNVTREADAIFPYMNAAVQGVDKLTRAMFKDNPLPTAVKAFTSITIPTIALYMLNHDNPNYQKLSNYNKDRFFLFPTNDGKFVKIPKPRELGVPFGAAVERALRKWKDDDPEAFRDFANTINIAFAPPGIGGVLEGLQEGKPLDALTNPLRDTIAGPLVDIATNKNFTGAPIVPGYLEGSSPRYQYDPNTSEVSKFIGDKLNVSPKQIDHLIRSYGGFIGQLGIPATTKGATLGETLEKQVTADPVFSTDATRYFYDAKNKLDTQYKDANLTGEIPEGYNDSARKYLDNISRNISEIRTQIRAIDSSDFSKEEKKNLKRELTEIMNDLARNAYENVRDLK